MVPRAVLMKSGLVSINTARQVNNTHPKITMNSARPMINISKTAHLTVKRPIHKNTAFRNSNFNQRFNTVKDKNVNVAKPKAVVNAAWPKAVVNVVKGNNVNAVKASACWVWKPTILGPHLPMISFVKETGCPSVSKVNNTEKSKKPTVKYAEIFNHLIKDCKKKVQKPVWNNTKSVNHQHSTRMTHPNLRRNMIPQAALMRSRIKAVNTAKPKDAHNDVKRNIFNTVKISMLGLDAKEQDGRSCIQKHQYISYFEKIGLH
ncbi:hypothetical protein Tco_0123487 [Tanacetum coccineum]